MRRDFAGSGAVSVLPSAAVILKFRTGGQDRHMQKVGGLALVGGLARSTAPSEAKTANFDQDRHMHKVGGLALFGGLARPPALGVSKDANFGWHPLASLASLIGQPAAGLSVLPSSAQFRQSKILATLGWKGLAGVCGAGRLQRP
jgi:hypothetical protein